MPDLFLVFFSETITAKMNPKEEKVKIISEVSPGLAPLGALCG